MTVTGPARTLPAAPAQPTLPASASANAESAAPEGWWRDAVIYQVYIRSFADGNGDGVGDLLGIRTRLPYLRALGVDAVWITPFYPSPMADGGYDVADYCAVDPQFGKLGDFDALIAEAHELGLRVIVDLVPNHSSDRHRWFAEALADEPGGPARARYIFRPGKGADGQLPPNDWESIFGGPAWTRTTDADGVPGEWYLHLFDPAQPDLNWRDEGVRAQFEQILRFWLDRGVDGFRVDVAHGMIKHPDLPDIGYSNQITMLGSAVLPYFDQDDVHEIHRWPHTCVRTSCTRPSTSTTSTPRGRPGRCAPSSTSRCKRPGWSARRPPGCCPTTMYSGTSRGTAVGRSGCGGHGPRRC
jgi:alpha-glucosidase